MSLYTRILARHRTSEVMVSRSTRHISSADLRFWMAPDPSAEQLKPDLLPSLEIGPNQEPSRTWAATVPFNL